MKRLFVGLCLAGAGCDSTLIVGDGSGSSTNDGGAAGLSSGGAADGGDAGAMPSGGSDVVAGAAGAGGQDGPGGTAGAGGTAEAGGAAGAGGAADPGFCETALMARDVSAGERHACAVTLDGEIYCWGEGQAGQLGNSETSNTNYPVRVTSTDEFKRVTTLVTSTCALDTEADLYCWGGNFDGVLADDTLTGASTPVLVLSDVTTFAAGSASVLAATSNQQVWAWGSNTFGQLGLGPGSVGQPVHETTAVSGVSAQIVTVGSNHTCVRDGLGQVSCSGDNTYGQLGQQGGARDTFGAVDGEVTFASLDAGYEISCGLTSDGSAYCFGRNEEPQLIANWPGVMAEPIRLGEDGGWNAISAGFWHVCLLRDERIHCLGQNDYGELGSAPAGDVLEPTPLPGDVAYSQVSAGREFTCAIRASDSIVVCFGRNHLGQLGRAGAASPEPTAVCIPP